MTRKSVLHIEQILAWADAHFERTGHWPEADAGRIPGTLDDRWININAALRLGLRGLRQGSSLARLLAEQRGKRNRKALPPYSLKQILAWADVHRTRTGQWPNSASGSLGEAPGETWTAVDMALRNGIRGLPGGSSLARLLAQHRGVRNRASMGHLSRQQILAWVDAHQARTGMWPTCNSGPVSDAPGETWNAVDKALRVPRRGLRGKSSLALLLERHRGVGRHKRQRPLAAESILAWTDAYHRRHGGWPKVGSGSIRESPGDSWAKINTALRQGLRGLQGGSSLARLLAEHHGTRYHLNLPPFTIRQILSWCDAHHRKHGRWPNRATGPIDDAPGETWTAVEIALRNGKRGLPGGSSLPQLLQERRGVPNRLGRSKLSIRQVMAWIDAHHERTGVWPYDKSGPIVDAPGETWLQIDRALRKGCRGFAGGSSLAKLLRNQRGVGTHRHLPPLTVETILRWADAHHKRTGRWPKPASDSIAAAPGETWYGVANALRDGRRGLPRGGSLARLLAEHRGARSSYYSPPLSEKQILAWADAYHEKHGKWPSAHAGAVEAAAGENWTNIDYALRAGARGCRGGGSLSRLLARRRRGAKKNRGCRPREV
ncbi:MAG TPA: hypothetical protein VMV69_14005 [Pirellulales bacterium]|nr:hypothetical protein [Pirellulales bacterium]